ncbi:MAG: pyridoxamine kinase [Prevotellaceae bacterium]|jgi:pyridoxine kinase|nr:pyridoxamine kinase [Prevotellaceae bacterium]
MEKKVERQKRVAAIHDISGFGKCSLTVALPILSAAGIETAVMPTAVLSTHTGGISGYTYRDLTEDMTSFAGHWKSLDIKFDALYSGFLGSFEQLNIVEKIFDCFRETGNIVYVDPVMADNGELYKIFPQEFPSGMRKLCKKADIVVPNITEAALLVDEPYRDGPYDKKYIESLLVKISDIGPEKIVLTGVFFDSKELGAATYDRTTGEIAYGFANRIPGYFHGTGDVFGSALLAAYLNGFDLKTSAQIAVRYTAASIKRTFDAKTDIRFGVDFERSIPSLLKDLNIIQV